MQETRSTNGVISSRVKRATFPDPTMLCTSSTLRPVDARKRPFNGARGRSVTAAARPGDKPLHCTFQFFGGAIAHRFCAETCRITRSQFRNCHDELSA